MPQIENSWPPRHLAGGKACGAGILFLAALTRPLFSRGRRGEGCLRALPLRCSQMTSTSSYARLRGLPFATTEQEVAQWFAAAPGGPLSVLRVFFTFNAYGRKSGEAVCLCPLIRPAVRN
jgi:hypothetical protein